VASVPLLAVLFALAGVVIAFQEALEGALAADLIPDETLRGTAFGALGAVNGVGDLVSSVVVGLLMGVDPVYGFGYAALIMLAGALLLYRAR
jgi:MFS family permease